MSDIKGIDKLFYELIVGLPDEIDFSHLEEFDNEFSHESITIKLKKIADQIFVNPYAETNTLEYLLLLKTMGVDEFYKFFLDTFSYGIVGKPQRVLLLFEQWLFEPDFKNRLMDRYNIPEHVLKAIEKKTRDHVLHQFNTFLIGLYIFLKSAFIKVCYEEMLKDSGYMAILPPRGGNVSAQFLEQWFVTAMMHDYGQVLESVHPFSIIASVINDYNEELNNIEREELKKARSIDKIKIKMDIGNLFRIGFKYFDYDPNIDIYEETLRYLEEIEDRYFNHCLLKGNPPELDHGINGAKVLLKMFNVASKLGEGNDIYQRYAMRNFIIPVRKIALHNLISDGVFADPVSCGHVKTESNEEPPCSIISNWTKKIVTVEKEAFKKDLLLTLLVACDQSANFDRIKIETSITGPIIKYNDMEVGHEHELKLYGLEDDSDRIIIQRERIL